jgi:hypothetical protein
MEASRRPVTIGFLREADTTGAKSGMMQYFYCQSQRNQHLKETKVWLQCGMGMMERSIKDPLKYRRPAPWWAKWFPPVRFSLRKT